jgi:fructokinase
MRGVFSFFHHYEIEAVGLGCFGPIDLNPKSLTYGSITTTPKVEWRNYSIVQAIMENLKIPVRFSTDVNGAALGEVMLGAAKGLSSALYITVGTGIGAGAVMNGQLLQGLSHPEMGHIVVRRHPDDVFEGVCSFHQDCLEGVASGPAIEKRWGKKGIDLVDQIEVWELESYYLAQAIAQYILILSPQKIILGGGVMKQEQLFPLIRKKVSSLLNGYVSFPELEAEIDSFIVAPGLGEEAGIKGALVLASQEIESSESCSTKSKN